MRAPAIWSRISGGASPSPTGLGIIGEYIGKIYMETKQRPRYIISERTWEEQSFEP